MSVAALRVGPALPSRPPPVTSAPLCLQPPTPFESIRSTVVVSGIAVLRSRSLFEAYEARLESAMRDVLVSAVAGTWLPVDAGMQHFAALDALDLGADVSYEIGAASGKRFGSTVWGTLVRVAMAAGGANPWVVLSAYDRMFGRGFRGGGFAVWQLGPKEAAVELQGVPFCRYAYFRDAFRGAHSSLLELFSSTVYVREVPDTARPSGFTVRISWV